MKGLILTAVGGVAVVAAAFTRPATQEPTNPTPVVIEAPVEPVRAEVEPARTARVKCANPCAHCSVTIPPVIERTNSRPVPPVDDPPPTTAPETPVVTPTTRPRPVDPPVEQPPAVRPPVPVEREMIVKATVMLPDGVRYFCNAPLPPSADTFTWRTFRSRANPKPILGLHLYAPRRAPDLVMGTVRFSNAAVRTDGTGFCGTVYYDSFVLTAPPGWEWVTLPQKGQVVTGGAWVVAATPADGSDHLARPRSILEWSYALVPSGDENARKKAEAALRYEDLVIPDPVADYGPARSLMPTVDRAKYAQITSGWAAQLLGARANGGKVWIENIADVQGEALGPHWMDGNMYGYAHGGYGIDSTADAPEQVPQAVLARALMHQANVARSFMGAFNIDTGKPIGLYEWKSPPSIALMSGEPGWEGHVELVPFLEGDYYTYHYPRFNKGTCAYEDGRTLTVNGAAVYVPGLFEYEAHDIAHSVRAMRHAIALIEYAKDPAARDFLLMVAESNRYGWFSDRLDELTPKKNPNAGYYPNTLTLALEGVRGKPNQGTWIDRNWAWSAFAGACAIEYEPDPTRRATWIPWGKNMLELSVKAADKFGFAGRAFSPGNLPDTVSGIQTFHEMLVVAHRATLAMRVFDGAVPAEVAEVNLRALRSVLVAFPTRPYGDSVGPPHWIGTADNNVELPALDLSYTYGAGDPAHVWSACAMTYRADPTTDEALHLALPHAIPAADFATRLQTCKQIVPNKAWTCAMESVLQQKLQPR